MSLLSAYQDLITSEHKGKPKYMATVTALLQSSNDIFELGVYIDDYFDLDEATGAQEDVLGQIVGQSRQLPFELVTTGSSVLDNEEYRTLLKAKIAKNLWKGGISDLEDTWQNLFGERIKIKDNQDMSIEVQLVNVNTAALHELILKGMIVPKPQSVRIGYNVIRTNDAKIYFGGALAQHKRYEVWPATASGGTNHATIYIGAALTQHKKYSVWNQPSQGGESETNVYMAAATSRWKKFTVGLKDN